uniref:Uncharacterized protein n=1 Tax=Panagrellus redivivus TaxID=6233 RepID=A0A7E4UZX0_PANRE
MSSVFHITMTKKVALLRTPLWSFDGRIAITTVEVVGAPPVLTALLRLLFEAKVTQPTEIAPPRPPQPRNSEDLRATTQCEADVGG